MTASPFCRSTNSKATPPCTHTTHRRHLRNTTLLEQNSGELLPLRTTPPSNSPVERHTHSHTASQDNHSPITTSEAPSPLHARLCRRKAGQRNEQPFLTLVRILIGSVGAVAIFTSTPSPPNKSCRVNESCKHGRTAVVQHQTQGADRCTKVKVHVIPYDMVHTGVAPSRQQQA